jgi:hypothetical protein
MDHRVFVAGAGALFTTRLAGEAHQADDVIE